MVSLRNVVSQTQKKCDVTATGLTIPKASFGSFVMFRRETGRERERARGERGSEILEDVHFLFANTGSPRP